MCFPTHNLVQKCWYSAEIYNLITFTRVQNSEAACKMAFLYWHQLAPARSLPVLTALRYSILTIPHSTATRPPDCRGCEVRSTSDIQNERYLATCIRSHRRASNHRHRGEIPQQLHVPFVVSHTSFHSLHINPTHLSIFVPALTLSLSPTFRISRALHWTMFAMTST